VAVLGGKPEPTCATINVFKLLFVALILFIQNLFYIFLKHEYTTKTTRKTKKQTAQLTGPKRTNQTFEMTEIDSLYRPRYNSKIIENIKI